LVVDGLSSSYNRLRGRDRKVVALVTSVACTASSQGHHPIASSSRPTRSQVREPCRNRLPNFQRKQPAPISLCNQNATI